MKLKITAHTAIGDVTVKVNLTDVDNGTQHTEDLAAWLEANIVSALVSLPGVPTVRFKDVEIVQS